MEPKNTKPETAQKIDRFIEAINSPNIDDATRAEGLSILKEYTDTINEDRLQSKRLEIGGSGQVVRLAVWFVTLTSVLLFGRKFFTGRR
jgi:hypothetical protein